MSDVRVVPAGSERIPELQDLWGALYEHHSGLPDLPRTRSLNASWERRRRQYEKWLAGTDTQLLIAERDGAPVGYAVLRLQAGPASWDIGERVAELETLAVAADARSQGVGARLVAAARAAAREAGAERLVVSVAHANAAALRFYEREGFQPFYVVLAEKDA